MQDKKSRLAIIHLAKKQLGLDDEAYRAILSGAGVSSAKDITTDAQFNAVMSAFQLLGFVSSSRKINKNRNAVPGAAGMITRPQEYYIKGLWALASRAKDEKSLRRMAKRIGKADDISFLSRRSASALILALRDVCRKAGFNPDTKEAAYVHNGKGSGANAANGAPPGVLSPDDGGNRGDQGQRPRRGAGKSMAAVSGFGG